MVIFYWVKANATPIIENGQVIGYMSVREAPSRSDVDAVSAVYRLFKQGKQGNLKIRHGAIVTEKLSDKFSFFKKMNFKHRLNTLYALAVLAILVSLRGGYVVNSHTSQVLESVYVEYVDNLKHEQKITLALHELQASLKDNGQLSSQEVEQLKSMPLSTEQSLAEHLEKNIQLHDENQKDQSNEMIAMTVIGLIVILLGFVFCKKIE